MGWISNGLKFGTTTYIVVKNMPENSKENFQKFYIHVKQNKGKMKIYRIIYFL